MARVKEDKAREERIHNEIVVDAHDASEQAMGWYSYLQDMLRCPFQAKCISKRAISPLRVGDSVEVGGQPGSEECEHEMFVTIKWQDRDFAVPLAQLKPVGADADTKQAVEDWYYWVASGYEI